MYYILWFTGQQLVGSFHRQSSARWHYRHAKAWRPKFSIGELETLALPKFAKNPFDLTFDLDKPKGNIFV